MAFATSYIAGSTLRDVLNNTITPKFGPASAGDTLKLALYNNSFVGSVMQDDPAVYSAGSYNANEVTGTGWSAGGITLSSNAVDTVTSGGTLGTSAATATSASGVGINFSVGNTSTGGTTLANAFGCAIYDNSTGTPRQYVICAIAFGGAFSTTAGTFAITWGTANSVSSVFYITLHA